MRLPELCLHCHLSFKDELKWITSQNINAVHACYMMIDGGAHTRKRDWSVESVDPSFCSGAGVQQRTDWCPFQAVKPRHHFRPLFLLKSWGRCCSLWGQPGCGSHLPQSHLGNFLWGLAVNCHRTASATYLDLQVKLASVVTQIVRGHSDLSKQIWKLSFKSVGRATNQNTK